MEMEHITDKVKQELIGFLVDLDDLRLEDLKKLLEIYLIISEREAEIFDVIYRFHGCDSWEDIFRDYSNRYLEDKAEGVQIAIEGIQKKIEEEMKEKVESTE
jgi:hypothetical protein